eukprot:1316865-Rhodomonas_salina.2
MPFESTFSRTTRQISTPRCTMRQISTTRQIGSRSVILVPRVPCATSVLHVRTMMSRNPKSRPARSRHASASSRHASTRSRHAARGRTHT